MHVMWGKAEDYLLADEYVGPLIKKWGHCRIRPIKKSLYFEDLVDAICSQQLSNKAARTIFDRIKNLLGGNINPDIVLKKKDEDLRSCGLSYAKVSYVKDLALKVKRGDLKLKSLDKISDEEVIEELVSVKGIGRWTAEMFLMFSLGRPDVFPVDDLGIKKGFEKVTGKKFEKIKSSKFAKKHWSPYQTVASWYLWRSLENE